MKRILVCGGRDYVDVKHLHEVLDSVYKFYKEICIVQGGAKGADLLAKSWAKLNGVPCFQCDANWDFYDKKAGSIRNQWMLELFKPDLVLAFPGGYGTGNMIKLAKAANVENYSDL